MNHITRLQNNAQITREWIADMRAILATDKFRGTERICRDCGIMPVGSTCLAHPLAPMVLQRKDWISTADLARHLDTLDGALL